MQLTKPKNNSDLCWRNDAIGLGDWIVIVHDSKFLVGRVLGLCKCKESSKRAQAVRGNLILNDKSSNDTYIYFDILMKILNCNLQDVEMEVNYFVSSKYICHLKDEKIDMRQGLKLITKFYIDILKKNK